MMKIMVVKMHTWSSDWKRAIVIIIRIVMMKTLLGPYVSFFP